MTVYCYDTEFLDDGSTIDLISIGIVCADGREYYAVNADMDVVAIGHRDWLMRNVVPHLPLTEGFRQLLDRFRETETPKGTVPSIGAPVLDRSAACVKPKWVIANEVREFIVGQVRSCGEHNGVPAYFDTDLPELWAYFGAYDHVALAQLYGPMSSMPDLIPHWTHDLMQAWEEVPGVKKPPNDGVLHNALADARWNMLLLNEIAAARRLGKARDS